MTRPPTSEEIDALLPQTQCTRCGYPGCKPYATALAEGTADLNRCPPGGTDTIDALAALLRREPKPLDPACGVEAPRQVALVDEEFCIGCTRCLPVCPVDAIVGAPKHMHTVIAVECSGCALCLPACPVDCIDLVPSAQPQDLRAAAAQYRTRFEARNARLLRDAEELAARQRDRIARLNAPR